MLTVSFDPFPTLRTERIILRRVTLGDVQSLFELRSNPEVMRHFDRPMAQNLNDIRTHIEKIDASLAANDGITWCISLSESPKLIGTIGFWRMIKEHFRAEIGYMLRPEFQRRGIMSEAIAAALNYGFSRLGLHSVEANVNPANEASIQLLEKAGFVREAYFRENYYWNGKFLDSAIYCKLATS